MSKGQKIPMGKRANEEFRRFVKNKAKLAAKLKKVKPCSKKTSTKKYTA